jgi:hypothetical protein
VEQQFSRDRESLMEHTVEPDIASVRLSGPKPTGPRENIVGEVGAPYQGRLCVQGLLTSPGEQQAPCISVDGVVNPCTIVIQSTHRPASTSPSGAEQEGICAPSTPRMLPAPQHRLGATIVPTRPLGWGGSHPWPAIQVLPVSHLACTSDGTPTAVALTAHMVTTRPSPVAVGITATTGLSSSQYVPALVTIHQVQSRLQACNG